MPNPKMTRETMIEAIAVWRDHGNSIMDAANALGINRNTMDSRIQKAKRAGLHLSYGARSVVDEARLGYGEAKGGWVHNYDPEGKKTGTTRWAVDDQNRAEAIMATLQAGIDECRVGQYADVPLARPDPSGGLLVVDLADVHIGKLCVRSETGYEYSREIAVSRMLQGTKALLRKSSGHGIARVLVVLGNDILHVDGPKKQTTSGTPQDTEGNIHQMYRDAQSAYIAVIEACAAEYPVDLIYCPSNHDWLMGWVLANSIGVWFKDHAGVSSSAYSLSESHRKYYRYQNNLIGLTHGDGAKEGDLYPLMMTEARAHVSDCTHKYWYLHHFHHKIRKAQGVLSHEREKDHIGMTAIKSGVASQEGDNVQIEYVRSPSPPDSWHDRKGYVNRQAVECFIHDPYDGQNTRFTEWF